MSQVRPGARSGPGGLPSNPRARSASRPRAPLDNAPTYATPSEPISRRRAIDNVPSDTRSLRSQRSLASLPSRSQPASPSSARTVRPPLNAYAREPRSRTTSSLADEEYSRLRDRSRTRQHVPDVPSESTRSRPRERPSTRSIRSAASSPTSDASSVFDRSWNRSAASSTRTSLDSMSAGKPKLANKDSIPSWVGNGDEYQLEQPDMNESDAAPSGLGALLWTRVTEAASALTVSMGQAWATNVPLYSGEVTPPGGESHLTRTLKAYHLSKAKTQSDLPDWLFSEQERGMNVSQRSRRRVDDDGDHYDNHIQDHRSSVPRMPARERRDVYPVAQQSSRTPLPSRSEPDLHRPSTKASDRLRAIRDAKRGAATRTDTFAPEPTSMRGDYDAGRRDGRDAVYAREDRSDRPLPSRPPARIGLPSRPGAMRRV